MTRATASHQAPPITAPLTPEATLLGDDGEDGVGIALDDDVVFLVDDDVGTLDFVTTTPLGVVPMVDGGLLRALLLEGAVGRRIKTVLQEK